VLDAAYLAARFAGKAQPLKSALLDQKNIAGLGNIYVCEALWRAGLSPLRAAGTLVDAKGKPKAALELLTEAIRAVIADAIAAGGSSLRDHIQTDGTLGYFQHSFSVYDREDEPCRRPAAAGPSPVSFRRGDRPSIARNARDRACAQGRPPACFRKYRVDGRRV
jgi:formamidopyrimidine-DNA glycosylase